jgi:hypothetical protein
MFRKKAHVCSTLKIWNIFIIKKRKYFHSRYLLVLYAFFWKNEIFNISFLFNGKKKNHLFEF